LVKRSVESKENTPKKSKTKNEKRSEPKSMGKKILLILPIIAIICIVGFVMLTLTPDVVKAQLIIESGSVQVKHTGSWTEATSGMELYQSDSVRTGYNSSASIILFKGSVIRLDNNTEITLKKIIQQEETSVTIQQDAGRTWNTVKKISGIDNYEVQTPTTVASVRGTSFDVNFQNGITVVSVIKGMVNISKTENGTVYTVELNENWSITVDYDEMGQPQPFEPDDWIQDNLLKDDTFRGDLKEILYSKIEPYIDDLKNLYGMTDQEIDVLLDGYINGDFPIPPETPDKYKELFELP